MGNTPQGEKWEASIIAKYGSLEEYKVLARKYGSKGGSRGSNGLKNLTPEQRSHAGKKGQAALRAKMRKEIEAEILGEME